MPKCRYCKKRNSCVLECKACKNILCTRCIDMSIHKCEAFDKYKETERDKLNIKLNQQKTNEIKIQRI